ncbi:MAG: outer membrane protein assembly factor BamC [Rubrivivax sp.]|nr:outer membrane protein assembly factor BamC [Rubrivivax sp.]
MKLQTINLTHRAMRATRTTEPQRNAMTAVSVITTVTAVAALGLLSGCSALSSALSGDTLDYRGAAVKGKSLEVPPDLTQLARDSRFQPQAGVISASAAASAPALGTAGSSAVNPAAGALPVAMSSDASGMRVERQGQLRWLVVPSTPEQLWPQLRAFWEQRGFTLQTDDAKIGVIETNWAENRAKLPSDVVRNTIGRLVGNLYDTGERDQFRMRIERTAAGSEIYVAHRGAEEIYVGERRDNTTWRARASDPQLEAEMLSRLMVALGAQSEPARALVANAPEAPSSRARAVANGNAIEIDDPFDRAWRRVGLALDRGGFTVEDRDRTLGVYYVRYVDPRNVGKEEPGFWSRLFGDTSNPQAALRYRIAVKGSGDKTTVAVLTSAGATDVGENGLRIASLLANELR